MRRLSVSRSALLLATLWVSACSSSDTAPSPVPTPSPTPTPTPTPSVTSVALASNQMSTTTWQLRADARLSDGTSREVTTAAQWETSNPAVAQVSSSGLLTALHSGTVDIRARYDNVVGQTSLTLALPIFSVSGIVSEAAPAARVFEGVRLTVNTGANAGMFTYTDDRGFFRINGLQPGPLELSISHPGYQPWSQRFTLDQDVTNLSAVLYPVPSPTTSQ